MKIVELLQEIRYHPRRKTDPTHAERWGGDIARYDAEQKKPFGYSGEWLISMGATPADIAPAMEKARKSQEYDALLDLGFKDRSTKRDLTNGTFFFEAKRGLLPKDFDGEEDARYRILVYGRITGYTESEYQTKLTSPQPHTIKTHPDLSPVDRIVETYKASMARLYKVQKPKFVKAFKERVAQEKK